jgi:7-cyano-7-deazaguanine synthase in queuosine biosynthesis
VSKLVLWSGGCDSTLVLYEALQAGYWQWHAGGTSFTTVRAVSISYGAVPCNREQRRARDRIKTIFTEKKMVFDHIEVSVSFEGAWPQRGSDGGAVQSQMWLATAAPYLLDKEDLAISWIDGECNNLPDAQLAFDALQRLNGKTGKLILPLWNKYKTYVVDRLKSLDLLDACWWCEDYVDSMATEGPLMGAPCGHCKKCIEHAAALWKLEQYPRDVLESLGMVS